MIGIVDYGLGNLRSVAGALERLGVAYIISSVPDELAQCAKFIIPGVGAFADGMRNLRERKLDVALTAWVVGEKRPVLGICLGAQLLAKRSFEFGDHQGLGWIDAEVLRMDVAQSKLRLPHVGWNDLFQVRPSVLFEGIPEGELFYYVHSFHIVCKEPEIVRGTCKYGIDFAAVLHQENIYATQFHPEKSQASGLSMLKNFAEQA